MHTHRRHWIFERTAMQTHKTWNEIMYVVQFTKHVSIPSFAMLCSGSAPFIALVRVYVLKVSISLRNHTHTDTHIRTQTCMHTFSRTRTCKLNVNLAKWYIRSAYPFLLETTENCNQRNDFDIFHMDAGYDA